MDQSGESGRAFRCGRHTALAILRCLFALLSFPSCARADADNASAANAFDVLEFRVLGNTVLDTVSIETAVYSFLGPHKQMADVQAARASLENAFHAKGFGTVFVDIPEQTVDDGIVRLHVTEGKIRSLRVSGERYFSGRQILAAAPAAKTGGVPNLPELQSQVAALNAQTADRVVVPVLKAGSEPGTVDIELKVDDHLPLHGSAGVNNQYTADTKPLRSFASLNYDNLFGRLDSLSFQYQWAPQAPAQTHVLATSYATRIADSGTMLSFQFIDSKSDVSTIGTLGVLGSGSVYGLHLSQPLGASGGTVQNLALGVDYKDFGQSILLASSGLDTPVSYINLSAGYSGLWRDQRQQWDWSATMNFGLRGGRNTFDFANKRFGAESDYAYLRIDGGVHWSLPLDFFTTIRVSAQYSPDPLISNEQFVIGGADSVRGYLEAEDLGDSGVRTSWQLNVPTLRWAAVHGKFDEYVFVDYGRVSLELPLPGQAINSDIRSAGLGFSFDYFEHLTGSLTWAYPMTTSITTRSGQSRVLFYVRGYW